MKIRCFSYCFVLLAIIWILPFNAAASQAIPDGEYSVKATIINASTDEVSRMNNALKNPLTIVVKKEQINVYLTLSRTTKEMNSLKTSTDGGKNYVNAKLVSENENSSKYMFQVKNLEEYIHATIYVDAMGASPAFRIAFDKNDVASIKTKAAAVVTQAPSAENTLNKAETTNLPPAVSNAQSNQTEINQPVEKDIEQGATEDKPAHQDNQQNDVAGKENEEVKSMQNNKTEDKKNNSLLFILFAAVFGAAGIIAFRKFKKA